MATRLHASTSSCPRLTWAENSAYIQPDQGAADIVYVDPDTGERRKKHLHDVRGTFATRVILAGLADAEVAEVMGW
jgi:hypothetical protein